MLEVIGIIVAILVVLIGVLLIIAATKPDSFRYERSISIAAPAAQIVPFVSDLKKWIVWSPYEARDPEMKRTYGARTEGAGATYEWDGNKNIGAGRMEITEATLALIRIKLDFFRPFKANNIAEFTFHEQGGQTRVVWAMTGKSNMTGKVMGTLMNMDRMVGRDFDTGLQTLKTAVEGSR